MRTDIDRYAGEIDSGLKDARPVYLTTSPAAAAMIDRLGFRSATDPHDLSGETVYVLNERQLVAAVRETAKAIYFVEARIDDLADNDAAKVLIKASASAKPWSVFDDFNFYSVPDLTDEERKPPEFIIDGLLPVGMTFLSGAPKIRKSFLAVQMAASVASGTPFWGRAVKQCDVVYLDLEGSKSRISSRTAQMSQPLPENVHITNAIQKRLADGLVDDLRALHRERPTIRFVIIDTFSRARGSFKAGGANAYDADVALLEPVQRMALEENISVMFVHHDKKGAALMGDSFERLSGTMGISGSADCVINLVAEGKRFDGRATLEYNPRDAKGGELSLVFDEAFLEWMAESKPTLRNNPVCAWIIDSRGDRGVEGHFYSYEDVYLSAYHGHTDKPGDRVTAQIRPYIDELFTEFKIGVQLGVKSNGKRGIRITNYL